MINRQNQPWTLTPKPTIDWDGRVPRSRQFDDIYFSVDDGVAESQYVFLEGSNFPERAARTRREQTLTVVETGFGTGLNFLLTLESWLASGATGELIYLGIDAWPLRADDFRRASEAFPHLKVLSTEVATVWPSGVRGCHRLRFPHWRVTLDLWWEDAAAALADLASHGRRWVDIWYLDGFAPARDQRIWSEAVFSAMATLSQAGATFGTFTAAGDVRRGLTSAGFSVEKRPGFGRKRDCLRGVFAAEASTRAAPVVSPWDLNPLPRRPASVLVLGAGLAGAFVARSLAERGIAVTVLDTHAIASGGSSNLQGLTYTRLSRRFAPLADFALASYEFATRRYRQLIADGSVADADTPRVLGEPSGFFQVSDDQATLDHLSAMLNEDGPARILSKEDANALLGLDPQRPGIFFPAAFWLNPPSVCQMQLAHPLISVHANLGNISVHCRDGRWSATTPTGRMFEGDTLVLATAGNLTDQPWTQWLPLQGIRGQTTHVPATAASRALTTAFCHEGYLPPAWNDVHCLGASYGPNDVSLDERPEDHAQNLQALAKALPGLGFPTEPSGVRGHVALRCTTADYLPVAGPVPDQHRFNETYADLSKKKTLIIDQPAPVVEGLWVLGGLGSRGLTAAPLAAELITSSMLGTPPPLPRYLQQALSPARFLARGLIRGKPL